MKKLIVAILALTAGSAFAESSIPFSSFTITNEAGSQLTNITSTTPVICHVLTGVLVSSPTAGGMLTIFNSSYTINAATVAFINLNTMFYHPFNDIQLKGITYRVTGNAGGVTIFYKR